jgi:predicted lipoprotein with Yx(FWY)xxD motif
MTQITHFRTKKVGRHAGRVVAAAVTALGGLSVLAVASSSASTSRAVAKVVVTTLKTNQFGTILMSGHTVYTLRPSTVACTTSCLKIWPELLLPVGVAHATAGTGVNAAKLGTVKRPGGRLQVTYAGKALYWFYLDKAPGQVKGNIKDKWGKWSVVVTKAPAAGTTTTTSGGGGGIGF